MTTCEHNSIGDAITVIAIMTPPLAILMWGIFIGGRK